MAIKYDNIIGRIREKDTSNALKERLMMADYDTNVEINPNKLYVWNRVESLTIDLVGQDSKTVNEYSFRFTVDSQDFQLRLPYYIQWSKDPTFNKLGWTYEVSIIDRYALYVEFGCLA